MMNGNSVPVSNRVRYALSLAIFGGALATRLTLLPPEAGFDFLSFFPAVVLSAALLGAGPSFLTVALGMVAGSYMFMAPVAEFTRWPELTYSMAIFGFSGGIVCFLIRKMQRQANDLRGRESHLQFIFDASPDALLVSDSEGMITMANHQVERLLGYTADELIGQSIESLLPDRFRPAHVALRATLGSALTARPMGHGRVVKGLHKGGRECDVEVSLSPIQTDHGLFIASALRDVTERKQIEADLRIAAAAFESQEGMMVTDANGVILQVNKAFRDTTGYTAAEVVGRTPRVLRSSRHGADFYRAMWETIIRTGGWQGEIWDRRKNGEVYPKWLTISAVKGDDGRVTHYIGTHFDITERKRAEEKIEALAFFDQLTGLPNRTLLSDRLKQAMAASSRGGNYGALLFIDLDNFKMLNDTLGHDVGDMLLKQVAERLTQCVREGDTVARLGGDEFVVVLAGLSTDDEDAATGSETVADKILTALNHVYQLRDMAHHSTASIGVTIFRGDLVTIDELMKQADLAMYKSKAAGRNLVRFFDPTLESAVNERAAMEEDLRRALDENQFLLYYQAQVVGEGRLIGAEALVRWQHPQRGMVSPVDFIPFAEETGLILPLGHWVLEAACTQLAAWASQAAMADLTLAVNVSAHQFRQRDFVEQVLAVIEKTGANPHRLKLELTESLLVHNVQQTIDKMVALKAKGVGFSLDDFGTGYSSLSYLKRLPLDQLKIDQSFVHDILSDPNDAAIAKTVVALTQSLGLSVIAEGVETEGQRQFLATSGCDACQGYFFSRPLPIDGFEQFAKRL